MLPTIFIKSFPNFPSFTKFGIPPTILHHNYRVREPHVSHTGINVCVHCPLHLPKKVTENPSVNHIGSSTSHQWGKCCNEIIFKSDLSVYNTKWYWISRSDRSLHILVTAFSKWYRDAFRWDNNDSAMWKRYKILKSHSGVFSKWSKTFIEFSEIREFRESEKSLRHELGSE